MATDHSDVDLDVVAPLPPVSEEKAKPAPPKRRPPKKRSAKPSTDVAESDVEAPGLPPKSAAPKPDSKQKAPKQESRREDASNKNAPVEEGSASVEAEEEAFAARHRFSVRRWLPKFGASFVSAVLHLAIVVLLALCAIPSEKDRTIEPLLVVPNAAPEQEIDTFEIQEELDSAVNVTVQGFDSSLTSLGGGDGIIGEPSLDQGLLEKIEQGSEVKLDAPSLEMPGMKYLVTETPDGLLGDPRAVVDNYDEAMDRITQEILWKLEKSDVLVVWAFDQSESMKDDQKEIRQRIDRVYKELGVHRRASGNRLTTGVTSYGIDVLEHTKRPTSDINEIRAAIDSVPIDPSGKEMMCTAVTMSIAGHAPIAKREKRQMMLVLVTDETGEKPDNLKNLEIAIATANAANCPVYVLGREAVFGYPYAHMRWKHPQTGHVHWLPVDRGPETGFVEQLQTDGFRRRYDAHPSGFGPYGQTRMALQTGGIFFMLPSLETDIVRGEKRRYELDAMRSYKPDLRHRGVLLEERNASILRTVIWKVIHDLDPYDKEIAKWMEVRYSFSASIPQFVTQVRLEQTKLKLYLGYLDVAAKALEHIRYYREQDPSPRWQANYDLILAQLLAYTARAYEYGAYLEHFIRKPKVVPLKKPGFIRLSSWHIRHSPTTVGGDISRTYIDRSAAAFNQILVDHPGTPWAARAEWELSRGFGFDLNEHYSYYGPRPPTPTRPSVSVPRIPIPNL
ncbi:MAG: VWA domain-containing protein [Planctomycetes bacterium]|nr:VWA domain-containing protein [Planctomycetota bacterium]